jgi:hypothetical protein
MSNEAVRKTKRQLHPIRKRNLAERIMDTIAKYETKLPETSAWNDLSALSTQTQISSVDADPEGIFVTTDGKRFEATANVHVVLNYGPAEDRSSFPDSYPAVVTGTLAPRGKVKIEEFVVDTSSFTR